MELEIFKGKVRNRGEDTVRKGHWWPEKLLAPLYPCCAPHYGLCCPRTRAARAGQAVTCRNCPASLVPGQKRLCLRGRLGTPPPSGLLPRGWAAPRTHHEKREGQLFPSVPLHRASLLPGGLAFPLWCGLSVQLCSLQSELKPGAR